MNPPVDYSEDTLVEKPAIALLKELGWTWFDAQHEFHAGLSSLGRENKSEVILKSRLREALLVLNSEAAPEAIHEAIAELSRNRSRPGPEHAHGPAQCLVPGLHRHPVDRGRRENAAGLRGLHQRVRFSAVRGGRGYSAALTQEGESAWQTRD